MRKARPILIIGGAFAVAGLLTASGSKASSATAPGRPEADISEARLQVQLLTEFYREALDHAHETWVRDGVAPAATVIKQLFPVMAKKGWPKAQWLSVNGQPLNPENSPRDPFEEQAARALRRGETRVEEVRGNSYRAVLSVPFTGSCYKCHTVNKPLHAQGAISFFVPLQRNIRGKASN